MTVRPGTDCVDTAFPLFRTSVAQTQCEGVEANLFLLPPVLRPARLGRHSLVLTLLITLPICLKPAYPRVFPQALQDAMK